MKNIKTRYSLSAIVVIFILLGITVISCDKEESVPGEAFFEIEGNHERLEADVTGVTQRYVVRSNRPWKISLKEASDWVRVFPDEGEDDGIFRIIVQENIGFNSRSAEFIIDVEGMTSKTFRVEQEGNVPFIVIENGDDGVNIPSMGGEAFIDVFTNVDWDYSIDDESWLSNHEKKESSVILSADRNAGEKRSAILTIYSPSFPDLAQEVVVTQSSGAVILEENFDWLAYGNAIPYETSGERRYDLWTQEEKDRGWYSTPVESSSGQQLCYARQGFVKLGKTNFGGDIISPKLDIDGVANVKVTFKAAGYISAGGAIDDNILRVAALGAGSASVSELIIDNIPNSRAQDDAGIINDIWDPARAYSFMISGATSETQIQFLGGAFELTGVGQGKNRIFLDDVKVEIVD